MSALTADVPGAAVTIHDPWRLEWTVTLPFPSTGSLRYTMKAELEIPTRLYVEHRPWSHLQALARLDWPLGNRQSTLAEVDVLRREVLDVDGKLVRACEGFRRHCLVVSREGVGPRELEDTTLSVWLDMGLAAVADSRRRILGTHDEEGSLLQRERALADEFLSVRALALLTAMTRHLEELATSFPREQITSELRRAYDRELAYRVSRDFCAVDPGSPESLEAYIARASALKKHFESLLYLQRETKHLDARMQPWIAALAALFAGAGFFLVQLVAMSGRAAGLRSGVLLVAIAVGILYAGRDRLKALAEQWLSTGLRRLAAERITRLLSPLEAHHVVARAKESFEERGLTKADALNPELGGVDQATLLRFVHSGDVYAFSKTSSLRPRALRLVFRYDVSPLFARLDDPVKSLAVADPEADRLQLVTASRTYRITVRLGLKSGATNDLQQYDLVLDKRGLLRLEAHA
ncbi:MAG: hypothetical protein ACXVEF_36485 [Polyangiales bacterium]